MTNKFENLTVDEIVENYMIIKLGQREKNKEYWDKLKKNQEKYFDRLNQNLLYARERIDTIKEDKDLLQDFKARRKIINKRAYDKRKQLDKDE